MAAENEQLEVSEQHRRIRFNEAAAHGRGKR